MQKEFISLLEETTSECKKYFKDRFCTAYLHGSIALNDAVPYVSDLDYYLVADKPSSEDKEHIKNIEVRLQEKYPIVSEIHIAVHSVEEVKEDRFSRFILRYNSVLYRGTDIVKDLEENGCERMFPDSDTAKSRLSFARQCFSDALSGGQPANTGEIPSDTYYAARKFARYFVVVEGAYFLMTVGGFSSFKKESVLKELRKYATTFRNILDITEAVLSNPIKSGITHIEYLTIIKPLVEWIFDSIDGC